MSNGLSARQLQVLPYFVAAASDKEGCVNSGVSRNTYYKWLNQPEFKAELMRRRNEAVSAAMDTLKGYFGQAVETLVGLLKAKNEALRRQTANDIISYTLKLKGVDEIEERLTTIEKALRR